MAAKKVVDHSVKANKPARINLKRLCDMLSSNQVSGTQQESIKKGIRTFLMENPNHNITLVNVQTNAHKTLLQSIVDGIEGLTLPSRLLPAEPVMQNDPPAVASPVSPTTATAVHGAGAGAAVSGSYTPAPASDVV
jgi:hypothetical protein